MTTLIIEVDGRTLRFDSAQTIRVGRSIDADVVLTAGSVSRQHAELRPVGGGWLLVDAGSQYGTFVDGARVAEQRVATGVTVQCGPESRGSSFTVAAEVSTGESDLPPGVAPAVPPAAVPPPLSPQAQAQPRAQPQAHPPPPVAAGPAPTGQASYAPPPAGGGFEDTQVLAAMGPGAFPGYAAPRTGPDLLVTAEGREYRFRHPATVRIGRQPDCDIVVNDPVCSRLHGQVAAVPGGWTYTNTSQEGTFDEGRRVDTRSFEERLDLRLGHPVAGPALSLVPILSAVEEERRFARRRRRKALLAVGAVVAVLALVGATITAAVVLSGDGVGAASPSGGLDTMAVLTSEELDGAKDATVLLVAESRDDEGEVSYSGSGSILRSDGLILTNAHVAQPSAEGLDEYYGDDNGLVDPDYLLVALVNGVDDTSASPSFRARTVSADGFRDVAVVQIYATADGADLDPDTLGLPSMPLGDSDAMQSGDDVTILGFPGISGSARLTVTKGVISTFIDREDLGPRSEIDTDARIAPGNSGGAAINNDAEIIGIPSAVFTSGAGSPVVSGRIRPINFVMDVIEAAER